MNVAKGLAIKMAILAVVFLIGGWVLFLITLNEIFKLIWVLPSIIAIIFLAMILECDERLDEEGKKEHYKKIMYHIENKKFSNLVLIDETLQQEIFRNSLAEGGCKVEIISTVGFIDVKINGVLTCIPKRQETILETFELLKRLIYKYFLKFVTLFWLHSNFQKY